MGSSASAAPARRTLASDDRTDRARLLHASHVRTTFVEVVGFGPEREPLDSELPLVLDADDSDAPWPSAVFGLADADLSYSTAGLVVGALLGMNLTLGK